MFPPAFLDRMKELELEIPIYEKYPRKSIHILNNEKEIVNMFNLKPVPWADNCFFTDEPKKIQSQYYDSVFIQDPASVVPVLALDVKKCHAVDLCAAPGSKTLHIAREAAHVIANDSHRERVRRLVYNVRRFNIKNCIVLNEDGRNLHLDEKVDRVLVDAPCTGEGMVGKIHKAMKLWNVKRINVLSRVQRKLVLNGLSLLKKGGVLVYSTCTFAPEENEDVIDYVLKKRNVNLEKISIKNLKYIPGLTSWREREYSPEMKKTIRIYPFHNCTNGFFVAKFRKFEE